MAIFETSLPPSRADIMRTAMHIPCTDPNLSPAQVYVNQLGPLGNGVPLWFPEPAKAGQPIRIGDVGVIDSRGSFLRLFNATVGANHPYNNREHGGHGVPHGFEVLDLRDGSAGVEVVAYRDALPLGALSSKSVSSSAVKGHAKMYVV